MTGEVKLNPNVLVLAVFMAIAILGYGYMNYRTKQAELKFRNAEKQFNIKALELCQTEAYKSVNAIWEKECKDRELEANCKLPSDLADSYEKMKEQSLDRCVQLYK